MHPIHLTSHSSTTRVDTWDRRYLAPYDQHMYLFTGVPIDIINYGPKLAQLIVASIYCIDKPTIEIDHVCMLIKKNHLNQYPKFTPVKFTAMIDHYDTSEYVKVQDLKYAVPVRIRNYTLKNPQNPHVESDAQLQHLELSEYIENRLDMLSDQTTENTGKLRMFMRQSKNDGIREETLAPYVSKLQRTVNRVSLHQNLRQKLH